MSLRLTRRPAQDRLTGSLRLLLPAETIEQIDQRAQDLVRNRRVVQPQPFLRFEIPMFGEQGHQRAEQ